MNELWTILLGMTAIGEVRAAIPVALTVFGFPPLKAYLLGVFGNILAIVPALLILHYLSDWLMHKFYFFNKFFNWLFRYTREKHKAHFSKYEAKAQGSVHEHPGQEKAGNWGIWGPIALFAFVAIPLPFTGAWTGSVAAFIFGIPLWRSVTALSLGAATSGVIVLLISTGIITGVNLL